MLSSETAIVNLAAVTWESVLPKACLETVLTKARLERERVYWPNSTRGFELVRSSINIKCFVLVVFVVQLKKSSFVDDITQVLHILYKKTEGPLNVESLYTKTIEILFYFL